MDHKEKTFKFASIFSAGMMLVSLQESVGKVNVSSIFELRDAIIVGLTLIGIWFMGYMTGKEK